MPGRRRARAPVASTTASADSVDPSSSVTVRVAGSRAVARDAEPPLDAEVLVGLHERRRVEGSSGAVRKPFDSGGRSYGSCASAPTTVMRPSKPCARSARAVDTPASDAPTTVTDRITR